MKKKSKRRSAAGDHKPLAGNEAILFIAATETDANLYYACRFLVSDPIAYLEFQGKRCLLLSELELGRARLEARVDQVISLLPHENQIRATGKIPNVTDMLEIYFKEKKIKRFVVPGNFPIAHADRLREKGFRVSFREDPFFPERALKTEEEIQKIAASQAAAEEALSLAADHLRRSRISGGILELGGEPLTAERLRRVLNQFFFEKGYQAQNTIIAGGDQACDPHVRGSGPLPAHSPIVIDIFPRSNDTRYWGDITRTFLRGKASPEISKQYRDVQRAQELGLSLLRDGADGMALHQAVADFFKTEGWETGEQNGKMQGFIHSTGHGIGLDIHEYPKIGRTQSTLKSGNAVTIEPGLYYFGRGGIRLEDTVVVTQNGHRNLTRFPKELVI
ncbi:MAG: aminopeptidase P family protein [Planctomycetes bacterium]|nr:aminopeptidase P family protein [Planctomycetota bacterium]